MADKVRCVTEVVSSIPDGAHIALGGFAIARNVIAVVHELIRQQKKNLTLSQCVMGMDTDLLVGAGLVRRIIAGGGSLDRFGRLHCVNRARELKQVVSEDMSCLSICFRYLAGALGISFIPIKSLIASEILERLEASTEEIRRMHCPFTGEEYVVMKALTPDVSVVHVQVADREGNCQIEGPRWENEEQAKAGRRVIVIAEELVPTEYIQRFPERTVIPAHRVEAVIHQPFGAHPTAVFRCYDYDADHLSLYVDHAKRPDRLRELQDGETVVVGVGLPQVAFMLAKRTHAPRLTALLEIGVANCNPIDTPVGLADSRIFYRGTCWSGFLDILGMNLHRGVVDVGFLGALEVDRFGNINTTLLKDDSGNVRYFNGSAGGNDVASLAKRVIIIMRHEKRKLPPAVAHLTSPGFVRGKSREALGLRGGGPHRVITDKAVLGFDPGTHTACLLSVHPGITVSEVQADTGFPLMISGEVQATSLPTAEELRLLRDEIDPRRVYLR